MDKRDRARHVLLSAVWREILATTPETVRNYPSAARAIEAGASVEDMVTALRAASYDTAYRVLYYIGCDHVPEGEDGTGLGADWALVALEGLQDDLMDADPSGRDTADLWE